MSSGKPQRPHYARALMGELLAGVDVLGQILAIDDDAHSEVNG